MTEHDDQTIDEAYEELSRLVNGFVNQHSESLSPGHKVALADTLTSRMLEYVRVELKKADTYPKEQLVRFLRGAVATWFEAEVEQIVHEALEPDLIELEDVVNKVSSSLRVD